MTASARRLDTLTSWYSDWRGLRVGVLGLGVSGFAVADTLAELGAVVRVTAAASSAEYGPILPVIGVEFVEAADDEQAAALAAIGPDLVVVSPGYPPTHPAVAGALERGIPVWTDVELAWRVRDKVSPAPWIVVTGTNGKTTTVQMAAAMLAAGGLRPAPCGNIGTPVLDAVRDPAGFDVLVVELSSHQLHYAPTDGPGAIRPHASVCTNLAADHLAWHGSYESYRAAKAKVYANTEVACVYNEADAATEQMVRDADVVEGARAIGFTLGAPQVGSLGVVEGILCDRAFIAERETNAAELVTVDELAAADLAAPHAVQNVLAASALARSLGVGAEAIRSALAEFRVAAHRSQVVALHAGVTWVDDSKATNPAAAHASLTAHDSVIWLVGGDLKGVDLSELVAAHAGRLRAAVVIGVHRGAVRDAFARHAPHVPIADIAEGETESVMARAVEAAHGFAQPADTVLLAPAAASTDQFANYGQRGEEFARAVRRLLGGGDEHEPAGS